MEEVKVSIIVTVYNKEKYIGKCLESLLQQTLHNIEIIVIDDCSTDNSKKIIEEYSKKDNRITYIKHKNSLGPGGARNTGIKKARAKYIGFVDGDDWVDKEMFNDLYKNAIAGDWDIVICGFKRVDGDGNIISEELYKNKDDIKNGTKGQNLFSISTPSFCTKLCKKALYSNYNIKFPINVYYEDLAISPMVYFYAKKIRYIKKSYYNYLWQKKDQKNSSISFTLSKKSLNDHFKVFEIIRKFFMENSAYEENKEYFIKMTISSLMHHIDNVNPFLTNEQSRNYIRSCFTKLLFFHINFNPQKNKFKVKLKNLLKKLRIFNLLKRARDFMRRHKK